MDEVALYAVVEDLYALYDGGPSIQLAAESQRAAILAQGWQTRIAAYPCPVP